MGLLHLGGRGGRLPQFATVAALLLIIAACLVSTADSRGFPHFPSQLGSMELQRPAWRELGDRTSGSGRPAPAGPKQKDVAR
ncbi:hypothetical protein H6P81_017158 [Aristolochia fimbriata]|uniref:Uncharacterized protein n=1 Tax=Aristolochia fimbriata TaxID=158543 RepID=A0AAV7DXP7_ARIFI|nr:hypothetical protein H6P81_017158 [Aristolochia fimbriata]